MSRPVLPSPGPVDLVGGRMTVPEMAVTMVRLLLARRHPEAIEAAARARALEVAELARHRVPLYRERYGDAALHDLADVPMVDKAVLRPHPLDTRLSAPRPAGSKVQSTSGTTGQPFEVLYSPRFARWQGLLRARGELERRFPPWQRRASVGVSRPERPRGALLRLLAGRTLRLGADVEPADAAAAIARWAPRVLAGPPHRVLDVGLHLPAGARDLVVTTHGDTIDPVLRHALTRTFGHPPLDVYGTSEVGLIASQCRHADLYHVQVESVLVELLDDDGHPVPPGGTGEVVVTGLHNPVMPIVRYRTHDRATLADRSCACGHRGQALTSVDGRRVDFASGAAGERISPSRLWLSLHAGDDVVRAVRRYQVHQVADGEIQVRLEVDEAVLGPEQLAAIAASYRRVAAGRPVAVQVLPSLAEPGAGKFRLFHSEVPWRPDEAAGLA